MNKLILLSVLAVLLVAGCVQSNTSDSSTPGQFQITISHTGGYSPSTFNVNQGETVKFIATTAPGTETHMHGITIDEYEINQVVTTSDKNNPVAIEFVADKAGTFTIYCKTCREGPFGTGHPDIRATLVVS